MRVDVIEDEPQKREEGDAQDWEDKVVEQFQDIGLDGIVDPFVAIADDLDTKKRELPDFMMGFGDEKADMDPLDVDGSSAAAAADDGGGDDGDDGADEPEQGQRLGIFIRNVVMLTWIDQRLDLLRIAQRGENMGFFYNPKNFGALIRRGDNPSSNLLISQTGKIVCTGCQGVRTANQVIDMTLRDLEEHFGYRALRRRGTRVENVVGSMHLGRNVDLDRLAERYSSYVTYSPQGFRGAIIRHPDLQVDGTEPGTRRMRMCVLCFERGYIVMTGGKSRDDMRHAYKVIAPVLDSCAETRPNLPVSAEEQRRINVDREKIDAHGGGEGLITVRATKLKRKNLGKLEFPTEYARRRRATRDPTIMTTIAVQTHMDNQRLLQQREQEKTQETQRQLQDRPAATATGLTIFNRRFGTDRMATKFLSADQSKHLFND